MGIKKYSYTEISKKYAVSEHTAEWANLRARVDELWSDIFAILETEEDTDADERFGKEFEAHLLNLLDAVENGIAQSVLSSIRDNKACVVF